MCSAAICALPHEAYGLKVSSVAALGPPGASEDVFGILRQSIVSWKKPALVFGLVLLCGIIAGLQPELARAMATVFLFWHYVFLSVVLVCVAGFIFLARLRAYTVALLLGFSLLYLAPAVSDLVANSLAHKETPSVRLKVVTYNWLGGNRDRSSIYAWLAQEAPDVIAIEEFDPKDKTALQGLSGIYAFRRLGPGDIAIFSKYPLVKVRSGGGSYRGYSLVRAITPQGPFDIYGVHSPTLRDTPLLLQRNSYLASLALFLDQAGPNSIVLGDFNTTRWDPYFTRVRQKGALHEDPRIFPLLTRVAVRRKAPDIGSPIDHILAGRGGEISNCALGPLMGSDHRPLMCQIRFGDLSF